MCPNFREKPQNFSENVVFSDETIVELYSGAKIYVRPPPNMRYHPNYITPTAKFEGKRVMFWGYLKFSWKRDIVVIDGNMNSANTANYLKCT